MRFFRILFLKKKISFLISNEKKKKTFAIQNSFKLWVMID